MRELVEVWKSIMGYEGLYEVSNLGRVRSLDREIVRYNGTHIKRGKMKAICNISNGYKGVNLCKDGKQKTHKVHRLVAQAFLPNPNNLPQVNHKDEDKTNNRVDNLEWCNNEYNINYSWAIPIMSLNPINGEVIKYASSVEASSVTGINKSSICMVLKNKRKFAGNLYWGYYNLEKYLIAKMNYNIRKRVA